MRDAWMMNCDDATVTDDDAVGVSTVGGCFVSSSSSAASGEGVCVFIICI